jgi:hypothetical protein
MRVTSGEFSVRGPNRQGQELSGSAEHRSDGFSQPARLSSKSMQGEAKLSNYPRVLATAPIAARHAPPTNQSSPDSCFAIWQNSKRFNESVALLIAVAMDRFLCENPNTLDYFYARFHGCVRFHRADSVWRRIRNRRNNQH